MRETTEAMGIADDDRVSTPYMIGLTLVVPCKSNKDADELALEMSNLLCREYGGEILEADFGSQAMNEEKRIEDEWGATPYRVHVEAEELCFHTDRNALIDHVSDRLAGAGFAQSRVTVVER